MRNFDFGDINLIPKYFDGVSRQDINTDVTLGRFTFKNPVIPANMESIINEELCEKLATNGYFYIMHRFDVDQLAFIKKFKEKKLITSISLGVSKKDLDIVIQMKEQNLVPDYITIDIAHGHSRMMKEALYTYKQLLPDVFIIAGNICTPQARFDLEKWGADAVKVGIAPGCFAAGTRILMSNGFYKNIEDIEPGEFIINKNGDPAKVKNSFSTGYRDVIKYRTNTNIGFTICTPDHKHYIGDLSTNNNIDSTGYAKILDKQAKTTPKSSKYKWKSIDECNKKNSVLLLPNNINFNFTKEFEISLFKKNINYVNLKPCEDLGYIFGTFLGDGHANITLRKTGSINSAYIIWAFGKKEIDIVNKLNKSLFNLFNKEGIVKETDNMLLVTFYDKPFTEFMYNFGKKTNKHLPENLLVDDIFYLQGLFDGLIDSDGHTNKTRLTFTNTSKQLIELINVLSYKLYKHFPNNAENISSSGFIDCNLENCAQSYRSTLLKKPDYRMTKDFQVVKILEESDDIIDYVETFDLEIDDDTHSFIANNVIVHNSVCTTAMETGFGSRGIQASVIQEVVKSSNIPIIADGGISMTGDVVKSLVLGATMCMCGSLVSGCSDSPGKIITQGDEKFSIYYGSASSFNSGKKNRIEGTKKLVPYKGVSLIERMVQISESIQSAISYGGGKDILSLNNVQYTFNK